MLAGEVHPAVVLVQKGSSAVVLIAGSSREHPGWPCISIDNRCRAGISMSLTKTTYFYGSGIKEVPLAKLEQWANGTSQCPPLMADQLLEFAKQWAVANRAKAGSMLADVRE